MINHILVIEDHPAICEAIKSILENSKVDYKVDCIHDGLEGLEIAQKYRPDLIFLDGNLPTMNGDKIAEALKSDPQTASIELVAITGEGEHSPIGLGLKKYCRWLPKPLSLFEINEMVTEIFSTGPKRAI